jgi:TRAP-type C4-dicarboxylate transport system substrate-binding protein
VNCHYRSSIAVIALALSWSGTSSAQALPTTELRVSHHIQSSFYLTQSDRYFADLLRERSSGQVTMRFFWGESLGGREEIFEQIRSNAIELGSIAAGSFFSHMPLMGMTNSVPMLFDSGVQAMIITRELVQNFAPLQHELKRNNVYPILYAPLPAYRLLCTRPVRRLEDLRNLRIRTFGPYEPIMFRALGAVPINMQFADMYQALSQGALDCAFLTYSVFDMIRLYEVAKHLSDVNFGAKSSYLLMTGWNNWHQNWPRPLIELLEAAAMDTEAYARELIANGEEQAVQRMLAAGVELHPFEDQTRLAAATPDLTAVWVDRLTQAGLGDSAQAMAAYVRRRVAELK